MLKDRRAAMVSCLLDQGCKVAHVARSLRMSEHTVRKYRELDQLPSQLPKKPRVYRTRTDPLAP
jgi:hypothetical protein